jgi:hypothetical protein
VNGGVGPLELKILIMLTLRALASPVEFEPLYSLVTRDGATGYFDFTECLGGLVKTGHAAFEDGKYSLTDRGFGNIAITEKNLPYSLRLKAERAVKAYRSGLSRDAAIRTSRVIRRSGGYTVELSLSDDSGDIVSIQLFAPSEDTAISLENGFRERAEDAYNKIIDFLTENGA